MMPIRSLRLPMFVVVLLLILAACDSSSNDAQLPTVAVLPTADDAATVTAQAAASQAALAAPTLPPEVTVTPLPTATLPPPTPLPTATPEGFSRAGYIYYIFNGDLIIELNVDTGDEQAIIRFNGAPLDDLALSPDGKLLAYVAPGNGLAREVWVSSRDASYMQQVSCLNFRRVENPTWHPNSNTIAFFAAPNEDDPLNLFIADVIGSGNCPDDNNQRQLTGRNDTDMRDMAWSADGERLFFSDGSLFVYDVTSGRVLAPLTEPDAYGPDYAPAPNPVSNELFYLKTQPNFETNRNGGALSFITLEALDSPSLESVGGQLEAESLEWSRDGTRLLIGTRDAVLLFNPEVGTAVALAGEMRFVSPPVFSPDEQQVAYIAPGEETPDVPQIFAVNRDGTQRRQITHHDEGTITDIVWAS
ncbi:MAG: WD40 repeat domain-containing protein [Chloroflexi bacterium]|nr:MAG: WD40 repeat domain-containing protein [Chloroflexota bacterium]